MRMGIILAAIFFSVSSAVNATDGLTEYFQITTMDPFDLNGISVLFTPDGSTNYTVTTTAITELPVDLAAITNETYVALGDDAYAVAPLSAGEITFFGSSTNAVFIGSNGYITFDESDTFFNASLDNHYDTRRISMFYRDLNPALGGSISYASITAPERFVITFDSIPRVSNPSQRCTAQCVFFLADGTISLSWIDTYNMGNTIVGLSAGQGYNTNSYVETDFTDLDGDGMADLWEQYYFGHITNCNALADDDLDTLNNAEEYIAGTSPTDRTSCFRIDDMHLSSSSQMIIDWSAVTGRLYSILRADVLDGSFSNLETVAYPQNSYTSTISSADGYYKVEVETAP